MENAVQNGLTKNVGRELCAFSTNDLWQFRWTVGPAVYEYLPMSLLLYIYLCTFHPENNVNMPYPDTDSIYKTIIKND